MEAPQSQASAPLLHMGSVPFPSRWQACATCRYSLQHETESHSMILAQPMHPLARLPALSRMRCQGWMVPNTSTRRAASMRHMLQHMSRYILQYMLQYMLQYLYILRYMLQCIQHLLSCTCKHHRFRSEQTPKNDSACRRFRHRPVALCDLQYSAAQ
jgi:hypothetical protein